MTEERKKPRNPSSPTARIIDRTDEETMLYLTFTIIFSADLVRYGVSRSNDLGIWGLCTVPLDLMIASYIRILKDKDEYKSAYSQTVSSLSVLITSLKITDNQYYNIENISRNWLTAISF